MKAIIIYHTHYGNTAHVVEHFRALLSKFCATDIVELKYAGGKKNIITRAFFRIFPSMVELAPVSFDLKDYDMVFFGIAVMGGHPASAMAKYLTLCKNIVHKKIVCFYVYSIDASMKSCARYTEELLKAKGQPALVSLKIPWSKVLDKQFMNRITEETMMQLSLGGSTSSTK